jgi:hypothetical protein
MCRNPQNRGFVDFFAKSAGQEAWTRKQYGPLQDGQIVLIAKNRQ